MGIKKMMRKTGSTDILDSSNKRIVVVLILAVLAVLCSTTSTHAETFCHEYTDLSSKAKTFYGSGSSTQGMCVAGKYIIKTAWHGDNSATTYTVINAKTGKEVSSSSFKTSHSNSLTYNPESGKVSVIYRGKIFQLDLSKDGKLSYSGDFSLKSHRASRIAYSNETKLYYLATTYEVFSTPDFSSFTKEFSIKPQGVNQGMGCDGKNLYINWMTSGNKISVYNLESKGLVGTYTFASHGELEEVDFYKDMMLLNINHGDIYKVESNHEYTKWKQIQKQTCGDDGIKTRTCKICGKVDKDIKRATGKHTLDGWAVKVYPSCEKDGERVQVCTGCKHEIHKEKIKATGHTYSIPKVTKEATVDKDGITEYTCTLCGKKKKTVIPKLEPKLDLSVQDGNLAVQMSNGDEITSVTSREGCVSNKNNKLIGIKSGSDKLTFKTKTGLNKSIEVNVSSFSIITKLVHGEDVLILPANEEMSYEVIYN